MPDDSSRISVEEAARRLGITADEVIGLRRRGKLRGYPDYGDWVFEETDVAQLAEEMQALAPDAPEATTSPPESSASTSADSEPPPAVPVSATEPEEEADDTSSPYQPATLASQTNDAPGPDEPETSGSPYVPAPAPTGSSSPPTTVSSTAPEPSSAAPSTPAPTSALSLDELVQSDKPIESARIIESLAARHQVGFAEAAGVVDGFWDHLLRPQHYKLGRRKLNMPHFGTFRLIRNHDGETELHFTSKNLEELRQYRESSGRQSPSTSWIDHWERHPASAGRLKGLSLKRRLSVAISEETGLDLRTTFLVLWDLVQAITDIMVAGQTEIRWARRGVLRGNSPSDTSHYEFRTYKRLRDRLPPLPAPKKSSGRGGNPRSGRQTGHRRGRGSTQSTANALVKFGCLAIVCFVLFLACVIGIAFSEL
jgi:hypothetical protein